MRLDNEKSKARHHIRLFVRATDCTSLQLVPLLCDGRCGERRWCGCDESRWCACVPLMNFSRRSELCLVAIDAEIGRSGIGG